MKTKEQILEKVTTLKDLVRELEIFYNSHYGDIMVLWIDLVTDSFSYNGIKERDPINQKFLKLGYIREDFLHEMITNSQVNELLESKQYRTVQSIFYAHNGHGSIKQIEGFDFLVDEIPVCITVEDMIDHLMTL